MVVVTTVGITGAGGGGGGAGCAAGATAGTGVTIGVIVEDTTGAIVAIEVLCEMIALVEVEVVSVVVVAVLGAIVVVIVVFGGRIGVKDEIGWVEIGWVMVISGGGTMFIGCWGCWSCMCSEGLVWTTMPPDEVVIMEVLTFWRACVPPTIMMDWPAAFLPWWKTGMEVGTSGGGTGVLDRLLIVGSILVTLMDCWVGTSDGMGMLVGPLVSVMLLLFRMI